jgi:uncharacterized protein YeeX (DUF496 family)
MSLETVVEEVKQEVVKVAEEVKAEVVKVEKAATVSITADEKLVLADAELEYLKTTGQIQQLQKITEAKAKEYQENVEKFLVKYNLSKLDYIFNGVTRSFELVAKKL